MKQDFRTLHETGFLSDIFSAMANSDIAFIGDIGRKILGRPDPNNELNIKYNIANSARALTATFPVIVSEATQLDQAQMISKAIERKAVEMLRMLFAANQITNATGAIQYLRKFHSNLDTGIDWSDMDVDDIIDLSNKAITAETVIINTPEEVAHLRAIQEQAIKDVIYDTKYNIDHVLETGLNQFTIRDFKLRGPVQEAIVYRTHDSYQFLNEIQQTGGRRTKTTEIEGEPGSLFRSEKSIERIEEVDPYDAKNLKDTFEALNKQVIDTDIKKVNEAVPSMVIINFVTVMDGGQKVVNTAVIGVKAVLHYVNSEDLMNRIVLKNSDNKGLLNFIRATTREISFFNDFLFAVKRARIDAIAKNGKGELRAHASKLNREAGKNNTNCAAIASMIISKAEVDIIKKLHRIDLAKAGTLLGIMRGYNMMCGVIVDEVAEKCDFLWDDSEVGFDTLSFTSLERAADQNMKKVINIMAANNRR